MRVKDLELLSFFRRDPYILPFSVVCGLSLCHCWSIFPTTSRPMSLRPPAIAGRSDPFPIDFRVHPRGESMRRDT